MKAALRRFSDNVTLINTSNADDDDDYDDDIQNSGNKISQGSYRSTERLGHTFGDRVAILQAIVVEL